LSSLLAQALSGPLNHVIAAAPWALEALRKHSGQTAAFAVPPFEFALTVSASGEVHAAEASVEPHVRIRLSPGAAMRIAAGDASSAQLADVEGDAAFGATLRLLAQNLRWDFEEDLARVVGDIAAHRAAGMLRAAAAWPRAAGERIARASAEFATEESGMLPPRNEYEVWLADVDRVRDDTERLEKRIARLEAIRR
jgi:ubiquinone biosynthesis accessory factor UbiJ